MSSTVSPGGTTPRTPRQRYLTGRPRPGKPRADQGQPQPFGLICGYFTNELRVTFFRRRNQLLLLVVALFPLLIGIGLKVAAPQGGGGGGRGPGRRAARRTSASSRATACSSRSSRCRCC